jgi:hypothetical protein
MPKKGGSSKKKNRGGGGGGRKKAAANTQTNAAAAGVHFRQDKQRSAPGGLTENDLLDPYGLVPRDVAGGRPFDIRWLRQNQETYAIYQKRILYDSPLAQRLGARDLCSIIAVAVERGDYKKLRVMQRGGIRMGFALTALNDYGCSSVNFAVATQNKPMLAFMHECGADMSMACSGPPNQKEYITPYIFAMIHGWTSIAAMIAGMIESRPCQQQCLATVQLSIEDRSDHVAADTPGTADGATLTTSAAAEAVPPGEMSTADAMVALGWAPQPSKAPASLRFAASSDDAPAIPIVTVDKETGERLHEDGTPLTFPSKLPASGAPIAKLKDSELPEGVTQESVVPRLVDEPDSLVTELVKCQVAERMLAEMPSFDDVLKEEKMLTAD